jgi:hypothetical protein
MAPKESIKTTKPGHEVYSSIQGEYVVSYITNNVVGEGPQYTVLGYLVLDEGEYSFTAEEGVVIPQDIYKRLFFVRHPAGIFELKFMYLENPDDLLLKNLVDYKVIATIGFDLSKTGGKGIPIQHAFFIFFDLENKSIYFHGIFNELQFYKVEKHWDD